MSSSDQSKGVGKKSLLRTLQTLGSVPEWKSEARQRGSDSEAEADPSHAKKKRKKKKRKRGRKHVETPGTGPENGEVDQSEKEEKTVPKRKKIDNKLGEYNSDICSYTCSTTDKLAKRQSFSFHLKGPQRLKCAN